MTSRLKTALGSGLLALLAVAGVGCAPAPAADPADSAAPGAVIRGDFKRELLLTGELRAVHSIEIKAPQTNLFQMRIQFMAEEGSLVEAGAPLLDFDNSGLAEQVQDLESKILDAEMQIVSKQNELESAFKDLEIDLAEAEYELERTRLEASVDSEVLSRKEYGDRQFARDAATERLEQTRERLDLTRRRGETELDVLRINRDKLGKDLLVAKQGVELLSIKAPAAGLVVYEQRREATLRYQEGDSCWPGQTVMRLPDLSQMQAEFRVSEVDAPLLALGMPLKVRLDSFPGRELSGEIVHIPSMAVKRDENSKVAVFRVLARLSETWPGEMKPGMSALGRVVVEERRDVPLVPRAAVHFDGEHYRLRRPAGGGRADADLIEPVARNDRYYVLSEEDFARIHSAGEPQPQRAAS